LKRFSFKYADTILYFGLNAVENLKNYINGYEHVTIVTGKSSAKLSGALKDVEFILKDFNVSYNVFDKIESNPTVECADELAYEIWENSSDAVIAIGGGSVIDTAKVASVIALSGGSAREYLRKNKVKRALPLYAVNLTHGTGSEIDRFTVLTDGNEKIIISIRYPTASIKWYKPQTRSWLWFSYSRWEMHLLDPQAFKELGKNPEMFNWRGCEKCRGG